MEITLHIGTGKTGTSSIQQFLQKNSNILLENKIFYSRDLSNIGINDYSLPYLPKEKNIDYILIQLKKHLYNNNVNHFIWSLESLFTLDTEYINKIKEHLPYSKIRIIVFLRRQDLWFQSAFYQWAWKHKTYHGNYLISFHEYYEQNKHQGDYLRAISRWANIFGSKSIIIQPFEKKQMPQGVVKTFAKLAGINNPECNYQEIKTNTNIGHYPSQLIGIYNSNFIQVHKDQQLIELFNKVFESTKLFQQKNTLLSPKQRIDIINDFKDINQKIANKYLSKSNTLFIESLPDINENLQPYEELNLDKTISSFLEIFKYQNEKMKNLETKINHMEKILKQIIKD